MRAAVAEDIRRAQQLNYDRKYIEAVELLKSVKSDFEKHHDIIVDHIIRSMINQGNDNNARERYRRQRQPLLGIKLYSPAV